MSEIEELADSFSRQFMIYRKKLLLTPPNVCKKLLNLMICESLLNSSSVSGTIRLTNLDGRVFDLSELKLTFRTDYWCSRLAFLPRRKPTRYQR